MCPVSWQIINAISNPNVVKHPPTQLLLLAHIPGFLHISRCYPQKSPFVTSQGCWTAQLQCLTWSQIFRTFLSLHIWPGGMEVNRSRGFLHSSSNTLCFLLTEKYLLNKHKGVQLIVLGLQVGMQSYLQILTYQLFIGGENHINIPQGLVSCGHTCLSDPFIWVKAYVGCSGAHLQLALMIRPSDTQHLIGLLTPK